MLRSYNPPLMKASLFALHCFAQAPDPGIAGPTNSIIHTGYSADPTARVFNGRLYVYPSHDLKDQKWWDMTDYHCYSTDDLANWQDHGVILDLSDVKWAASSLWAPDIVCKDGTYYFFFPAKTKSDGYRFGVATSKQPFGPFVDSGKFIDGPQGIDPAVLLDDDGQAYLAWGAAGAQPMGARLKSNLLELDGSPAKIEGIEHFFEGPWFFKRKGLYYFTYPAQMEGGTGHGGQGQNYDYAISDKPLGPYSYKGHFTRTNPGEENIHGSQLEWNGKWYCVYHDYTTAPSPQFSAQGKRISFKRNVRIDEMQFNPDGTIQELHKTRVGPAPLKNFNPYARCEAECLNKTEGPEGPHAISTEACSEGGVNLTGIHDGAWVRYANVDFGAGASRFAARTATEHEGVFMELRIDSPEGTLIGKCPVTNTGAWQKWGDSSCPVKDAKGVHQLYVKFTGPASGQLLNFDWFSFSKAGTDE